MKTEILAILLLLMSFGGIAQSESTNVTYDSNAELYYIYNVFTGEFDYIGHVLDTNIVKTTGSDTIYGIKTFLGDTTHFQLINTGQGATEVYLMNQNVLTTSDVTFDEVTCNTLTVGYMPFFEKELSDDENNINVGFILLPSSLVFYNGNAIKNSRWSGEGTQIINLNTETKLYDNLIVKQ